MRSFSSGALDDARMRRIGFGEATRSPVLIERTKAEVAGGPCMTSSITPSLHVLTSEASDPCAGTLLTARLALQHGLACNVAGGTHHAFPDTGAS